MSTVVRNAVYSVSSCHICIYRAKSKQKLSLVPPAYNVSILRLRQDGHEFEANLGYVVSSELQKETLSLNSKEVNTVIPVYCVLCIFWEILNSLLHSLIAGVRPSDVV